ncbi:MAG: PepSY-associated TM helix domain-containing protein, partial [Bacteroidota bacterium]
HWQHLLTKFYAFVKEGKWKVIWTNAHTVLGVISLPFQLMYAVTGAFFGLLILVLLPVVALKYDGDQSKVLSKIRPFDNYEIKVDAPAADNMSLAELGKQVLADYPEAHINRAQIMNYGKEDAAALFAIDNNQGVHAMANIVVRMRDGRVLEEYTQRPEQSGYAYGVLAYIFKLHFATFGGIPLRILYFVLSMVTCFMIVSGILIWRTARDNKRYTFKQRLFHHRVTKWYLAICLSMFPAFAIIFVANKLVPIGLVDRVATVNSIFFLSWLGLTLLGLLWNKYSQQNRNYLIIGGFLSLLIPIVNGIVTGDWIWNVWHTYEWVAYVDVFWLLAGLTALYISFFHLKVKTTTDKPQAEEEASADTPVIEEENTVEAPITMFKPKLGLD